MAAGFDLAALTYDADFSYSNIGKSQRAQVHAHLERILAKNDIATVLELGCGTGCDAEWFASRGYRVTATDASAGMIAQARSKNIENATFIEAGFDDIGKMLQGRFDMAFSNFGALNCADPQAIAKLSATIGERLNPGGIFVGVIMPRETAWERLYFSLRPAKKKWDRGKGHSQADLPGSSVPVWYYNPVDFIDVFSGFDTIALHPIGFFVPPSYLENATGVRACLNVLSALDTFATHIPALSRFSDHYLVALRKK